MPGRKRSIALRAFAIAGSFVLFLLAFSSNGTKVLDANAGWHASLKDAVEEPLCPRLESAGGEYGGWTICTKDPPSLRDEIVYTVGVGRDINWDLAMIEKHKTRHYGWDPTPTAADFFQKRGIPEGFTFQPYGLGVKDGTVMVKLPVGHGDSYTVMEYNKEAQEGTVTAINVLCLKSMMEKLGHKRVGILKMDIEGAEFDVIESWLGQGYVPPVDQILIEFHGRFFPHGSTKVQTAIQHMAAMGFHVVHKQKNFVRTLSLCGPRCLGDCASDMF